ncbi:GTPase domain-containing protein [Rhodobacter sp. NTK016B]|uniref:GTPase n=1 Tax=Rhodobacter sp. NTK016B TaxID=2759676 RepID=UPI001A8F53DA|nr:GTPase domain-containing protein [Rhodobacter sp. NTK016B]
MTDTKGAVEPAVPVLWLLGKTGAGKTSLVRALTGAGEVGNGFAPGTTGAAVHDFPADAPAVRFLDTRGLGEAGHDSADDIATAQGMAQAILAVVRLDDPVQAPVAEILRRTKLPVLLVHTGADLVPDPQAQLRARAHLTEMVGREFPSVTLAMPREGLVTGVEDLLDALDSFLPRAAAALRRADEARAFQRMRKTVLRYAALAGATDVVPVAGLATVPATQAAMLRALAKAHEVDLTPTRMGLLASALGVGSLARMGAALLARQGAKLLPIAGQTVGAAAAAGASFATTYALGRAASAWLYGVAHGAEPDSATLRALYDKALKGARNDAG